jgi:outer membrane scaffolding protein for murein synthesis (MipA/OmpV family)
MIVEIIDTPAPYVAAVAPAPSWTKTPSWTKEWRPQGGISAEIGGVVRARPAHIGSATPYVDVYPVIEIRVGDRLQISADDGIKYQAWKTGPFSAGPVVQYREAFRDKLPRGARAVPDAIEGGGYVEWKTAVGDVETRLRRALTGYEGWSSDTAFDTGGYLTPRFGVGLELRGAWVDAHYTRRFLDIHPQHAPLFSWPHFGPQDYGTIGAQLTAGYRIGPRLTAFVQSSLDRILSEAWRSPILRTRNMAVTSLGLTWHFGRVVSYGKLEDQL